MGQEIRGFGNFRQYNQLEQNYFVPVNTRAQTALPLKETGLRLTGQYGLWLNPAGIVIIPSIFK
ncbi:hypothetical protein HMI56_006882, partial [Coelomomyces lativittatus]